MLNVKYFKFNLQSTLSPIWGVGEGFGVKLINLLKLLTESFIQCLYNTVIC